MRCSLICFTLLRGSEPPPPPPTPMSLSTRFYRFSHHFVSSLEQSRSNRLFGTPARSVSARQNKLYFRFFAGIKEKFYVTQKLKIASRVAAATTTTTTTTATGKQLLVNLNEYGSFSFCLWLWIFTIKQTLYIAWTLVMCYSVRLPAVR